MRPAAYLAGEARQAGWQEAGAVPRLLPAGFAAGQATLAGHRARYGPEPEPPRSHPDRMRLIREVEWAGLTGRGGAHFPTARKLAAVAAGPDPVVVANGTEGEPASAKDKILLARSPHLVLDGAAVAAAWSEPGRCSWSCPTRSATSWMRPSRSGAGTVTARSGSGW